MRCFVSFRSLLKWESRIVLSDGQPGDKQLVLAIIISKKSLNGVSISKWVFKMASPAEPKSWSVPNFPLSCPALFAKLDLAKAMDDVLGTGRKREFSWKRPEYSLEHPSMIKKPSKYNLTRKRSTVFTLHLLGHWPVVGPAGMVAKREKEMEKERPRENKAFLGEGTKWREKKVLRQMYGKDEKDYRPS